MPASFGPRFWSDFLFFFENLWKKRKQRAQRSFGKSVTCDNVTSKSGVLLKWKLTISEGVLVPNPKVSTKPDQNEFHHKRWLPWLTLRALASQVNLVICRTSLNRLSFGQSAGQRKSGLRFLNTISTFWTENALKPHSLCLKFYPRWQFHSQAIAGVQNLAMAHSNEVVSSRGQGIMPTELPSH